MDPPAVDRSMTAARVGGFDFQYGARRPDDVDHACHNQLSNSDKGAPAMSEVEKLNILFINDQPAKRLTYQNALEDLGDSLITVRTVDEGTRPPEEQGNRGCLA